MNTIQNFVVSHGGWIAVLAALPHLAGYLAKATVNAKTAIGQKLNKAATFIASHPIHPDQQA